MAHQRFTSDILPPQIHEAKPTSFWLGCHTSLSDRFRTEALSSTMTSTHIISSAVTSSDPRPQPVVMDDGTQRNSEIFHHLDTLCTTAEARSSLAKFKVQYEARYGIDGEGKRPEKNSFSFSINSTAEKSSKGGCRKGKGWLDAFTGRYKS